jgi:hypothetical protein
LDSTLASNVEHCRNLSEFFIKEGYQGNKDLDVISTYLAFQIAMGMIDEEDLTIIKNNSILISKCLKIDKEIIEEKD